MCSTLGSSPLARGLQINAKYGLDIIGIIPARAGFTWTGDKDSPSQKDHPRSRGVYDWGASELTARVGSSPLARGLLMWAGTARRKSRIIPARAGFTAGSPVVDAFHGDHPRSRGVYEDVKPPPPIAKGSSPLARGLQNARDHAVLLRGIIPARAGFTPAATGEPGSPQDHPRSRGVYGRPGGRGRPARGSSPLARGLRSPMIIISIFARIIPARAGFTIG